MKKEKYTITEVFEIAQSKGSTNNRLTIARDLEALDPFPETGKNRQKLYDYDTALSVIEKRSNLSQKDLNIDDELLLIKERKIQKHEQSVILQNNEYQRQNYISYVYDNKVEKNVEENFKSLELKFMLKAIFEQMGNNLDSELLKNDIEKEQIYLTFENDSERDVSTIKAMNRLENYKNYIIRKNS